MDFCHLIVTCLFSKLRLPFDNQKVKENYAIFHGNFPSFSKNFPSFFKNIKVFLCTYALVYTYGGTSLRVRMRKPTHIYASGYTYIRINLHLYRYYVRCRTGQIGTVRL